MEAWLGGAVWAVEMLLIGAAVITDGETLLSDSHRLQTAEQVGSVLYFAMQCYYTTRLIMHLRHLRQSLDKSLFLCKTSTVLLDVLVLDNIGEFLNGP
ncbi:MAG: hypothetical protein II844_08900 [Prevotella sp.]|nr:hypothetical protein [Prevotella sp.]